MELKWRPIHIAGVEISHTHNIQPGGLVRRRLLKSQGKRGRVAIKVPSVTTFEHPVAGLITRVEGMFLFVGVRRVRTLSIVRKIRQSGLGRPANCVYYATGDRK